MTKSNKIELQTTQPDTWSKYFKSFFFEADSVDETPKYPARLNRYFNYGWNQNYQYCYTNEEIRLAQTLHEKYAALTTSEKNHVNPFALEEEKQWYDWWLCQKPKSNNKWQETGSFTLPNREAKDATLFPLWNYADNMARQIANWQGERVKNQQSDLMNDPVMLVLDELKDWFFNHLSEKGCHKEDLEYIAKRQSYIRNIIHTIPNFGPDRLYLHEIQNKLQQASQIIVNCIANKQLPDLLSDIIIKTKSLETTIGTYLHFLLINEEVADNFSYDFTEPSEMHCKISPICKVYQNAQDAAGNSFIDSHLMKYLDFNKFYTLNKYFETDDKVQIKINFKENLLRNINFANFVTKNDLKHYLEAVAALESLISVRKTLENFKDIQSSIGTYIFAMNYLDKTNSLSENYIELIDKTQSLLESLLNSANGGLKLILKDPKSNANNFQHFEKNIRALDTLFAKDTTAMNQLETYCEKAKVSMSSYQDEMKKLVAHLNSGEAAKDIGNAMQNLVLKINFINSFLNAQLGERQFELDKNPENIIANMPGEQLNGAQCDAAKTLESQNVRSFQPNFKYFSDTRIIDPLINLSNHNNAACSTIKSGSWDPNPKKDPITSKPIFTYRVYDETTTEIGSIDFFGQPLLCASSDGSKNNILKLTGVLSDINITDQTSINEICESLPPGLFDRVLFSAANATLNGVVRGGSNLIGATLKSQGMSIEAANFYSQLVYYSCIFSMNFGSYFQQLQEEDMTARCLASLLQAAIDTGRIGLINFTLDFISSMLDKASHSLEGNWSLLSKGVKKISSMLRFGIFAYSASENSVAETSTALLSGTLSQLAVEKVGSKLLHI